MKRLFFSLLAISAFLCIIAPTLIAQRPPGTDIYLLKINQTADALTPDQAVNITPRKGYDNQPRFLHDGSALVYTSIREDGQADIYLYSLGTGKTSRLTQTPESEYSPTPMPDSLHFSVVRVEADSSQRLWAFPLSGGEPRLLIPDLQPVGYHAWGNEALVALFILGRPNSLYFANIKTAESQKIIGSIGRSLHKRPGRQAFSFVHKTSETDWWIKEVAFERKEVASLVKTLSGSEDYTWTPSGNLLMGEGARLYKFNPAKDTSWSEITDLSSFGIKSITRLAVSPDGKTLALVSTE